MAKEGELNHMCNVEPAIAFFRHMYTLSNHHEAQFNCGSVVFQTAEHYYMHKKCIIMGNNTAAASVLKPGTNAKNAKSIGSYPSSL